MEGPARCGRGTAGTQRSGPTCSCPHWRQQEEQGSPSRLLPASPHCLPSPPLAARRISDYLTPYRALRNALQTYKSTQGLGMHSSKDKASCLGAKGSAAAASQARQQA